MVGWSVSRVALLGTTVLSSCGHLEAKGHDSCPKCGAKLAIFDSSMPYYDQEHQRLRLDDGSYLDVRSETDNRRFFIGKLLGERVVGCENESTDVDVIEVLKAREDLASLVKELPPLVFKLLNLVAHRDTIPRLWLIGCRSKEEFLDKKGGG